MISFDIGKALSAVAMAPDRSLALQAYRHHHDLLKDWRVIYADGDVSSNFRTRRTEFAGGGRGSSVFRGSSLWLLDNEVVTRGTVQFQCGTGTYLDSNAASLLRSVAYNENPKADVLTKCKELAAFLGPGMSANPYLYLWEAQRHWNAKTIQGCRESFAVIHALGNGAAVPDLEWARYFRAELQTEAEAVADSFIADFQLHLDNGLSQAINDQVELVEAMLVRTKIIEYSSHKSAQHKLSELVRFMHEDLSTIMAREMIVCADILCRDKRSRLSQKLNSVRNGSDPFGVLRNCAWDLFLPRAMDMLVGSTPVEGMDFYLPHIVTFDVDVADILKLTELRAVAIHRPSGSVQPFFDQDPLEWLSGQVGEKRVDGLMPLFTRSAYGDREQRRSRESIKVILEADRERLKALLNSL